MDMRCSRKARATDLGSLQSGCRCTVVSFHLSKLNSVDNSATEGGLSSVQVMQKPSGVLSSRECVLFTF